MRNALGKGLEALLPGSGMAAPVVDPRLVPIAAIAPNPGQPRRVFVEDSLASLAESIRQHGLLQPLVVRRAGGRYELIAGERRLRAAQRAGLETVPVVVREADREEQFVLALIENLQREDLTPLEEAQAYRHLVDDYGLTQEQIAERVGKSRSAVANTLRLLTLPDSVKTQLERGEISAGHARALLATEDPAAREAMAREVSTRKLSVRDTERLAAKRRTRPLQRGAEVPRLDLNLRALADELTRDFGTRVRISRGKRGGAIEMEFYSDAELSRLIDRLRNCRIAL